MAYVYMAGGAVLQVPVNRDAVVGDMLRAKNLNSETIFLEYEVDFPAGASKRSVVTVNPALICIVSEEPLS